MLKYICYFLLLAFFSMLFACTSKKNVIYESEFTSPPVAPSGMRVTNPYISALNESCYSLVSLQDPFIPNGAICKRKGIWEVIPSISNAMPIGSTNSN